MEDRYVKEEGAMCSMDRRSGTRRDLEDTEECGG